MNGYLYNYKTGESEILDSAPLDRLEEFIPQDAIAQNIFQTCCLIGMSKLQAFEKVHLLILKAGNHLEP